MTVAVIGSAGWYYREPIRLALYPWLNDPSVELVSSAVLPQLEGPTSRDDQIEATLFDIAVNHKRGEETATWSGRVEVTLNDSRYVLVAYGGAAKEARLDIDAFTKALKLRRDLPAAEAPYNTPPAPSLPEPDEDCRVLAIPLKSILASANRCYWRNKNTPKP